MHAIHTSVEAPTHRESRAKTISHFRTESGSQGDAMRNEFDCQQTGSEAISVNEIVATSMAPLSCLR
jgi:hypothetical protein